LALGFLATKARPDVLTLALPADLAAGLVDALEHLRTTATPDHRVRLDDLAPDLAAGTGSGPTLEVTARRDLLRELLVVAIDEAGDKLSQRSTRLLRGGSAAELRGALAELGGLLDLLEAVEAGG
jgi:hypothetical protein